MGQKVNPLIFRIPYIFSWQSRWFARKNLYKSYVLEDYNIRKFLLTKFRLFFIEKIFIERAGLKIRIRIHTSKPGLIIGRGGKELEMIKKSIKKLTIADDIIMDIQEVKNFQTSAKLIALNVAIQLENKLPFRRIIKQSIQNAMLDKNIRGVRVQLSGRLGGAEIARREWMREGSIPLHTIKSKVFFGFEEANTKFGLIGVKCWVCIK